MKRLFLSATVLLAVVTSYGQDTLPKFTVKNLGLSQDGLPNVVISWVNPFETLKQVSIQTSHDSIRNYRTLISLTDPNAKMNGFADKRAPNGHMFYRLFVVKGNGEYFFTVAKKPFLDTARTYTPIETAVAKRVLENPVIKNPGFVPSFYVYTNRDGYVFINLPDAEKQQYHLKFFEEDYTLLFEIKNVKQPALTLDKANFHHAGWFNFELYNDDKLVEKHKFYLNKDF